MTGNLVCTATRAWHCWNSFGFDGALAAHRIVSAITAELYNLNGFDAQFTEMVMRARQERSSSQAERWQKLLRDEDALAKKKENFEAAIAKYGPVDFLGEKLNELKARQQDLARERYQLERLKARALQLPESVGELREKLEEEFHRQAFDSPEFGDLMRLLVPEFHVYLVRLLDGGHALPRARAKLDLGSIVPDTQYVPGLGDLLTKVLTLDLFEQPPQRERIREEAVRLANQSLTQRQIAARLAERPEQPAVQRALALNQRMTELGLDSPYVLVLEPPDDYPKLRKHKHPRYSFQPRESYQRPAI